MKNLEEMIEVSTRRRQDGDSLEEVMEFLRGQGAGIVDSLKIIRAVEGIRLSQAKEIVDSSRVWSDLKEKNQKLREAAMKSIER